MSHLEFLNPQKKKIFLRNSRKKNISRKFEEDCLKNEGEDRFLVIFKISDKIDPEKFAVYTFVLETFYNNYNIS